MKRFLPLIIVLSSGTLLAQDIKTVTSRKIELLPSQKQMLVLRADERNPYARRAVSDEEIEAELDGESEEERIRRIFERLPVTGVSRGRNGLRALVGDMILERGFKVPQMLSDQTEFLVVAEVAENEITLAWIDQDKHELTGKDMKLTFDLDPRVRSKLAGQSDKQFAFFERKIERERKLQAIARAKASASTEEEQEVPQRTTALNGLENFGEGE